MLRLDVLCLQFVLVTAICAQCPHKHKHASESNLGAEEVAAVNPPGSEPEEQFVQTTFVHRDKSEEDLQFTQTVIDLINTLRPRLKTRVKLTIDNENVDCEDSSFPQCQDYPVKEPYHFFVVEDASHGAAVYNLDRKYNVNPEKTELALLDALSRHSQYPLMSFASEKTEHEVGFVREVTPKEMARFARENQASLKQPTQPIFTRSFTELNLLNDKILEFRKLEEPLPEPQHALKSLVGGELNSLLEEEAKHVFVLFWTRVNAVSVHALQLWQAAAEKLVSNDQVVLASVACHDEIDVCRAFGITHQDKHTVLAYKETQKLTAQYNLKDADFYIEWVRMVVEGPLIKLEDKEKLKEARRGYLDAFLDLGQRVAITIGTFPSEESTEFKNFQRTATILHGRYHFVYSLNQDAGATVTTFRPFEKMRRLDYAGNFDISSLIHHVTTGSVPSVIDFGHGFTSDIVYFSAKDVVLLVHNEDRDRFGEFNKLAGTPELAVKFLFAHIDRANSVSLEKFFKAMDLTVESVPLLCVFSPQEARCFERVQTVGAGLLEDASPSKTVKLSHLKPHPLKYVQLEHVNVVFGVQEVELLPEPVLSKPSSHAPGGHHHHHHQDGDFDMDAAIAGGCPMMAHLKGRSRDEL